MTPRRLAAAAATAALMLLGAAPSRAADVTVPTIRKGASAAATGDNGGFTSPDPDTPATTTTPPIAGRVKVNGCISSIELATGPLDGQAGPNARATVAGNGKGTQDFAWPDTSKPVLADLRSAPVRLRSHRARKACGPLRPAQFVGLTARRCLWSWRYHAV